MVKTFVCKQLGAGGGAYNQRKRRSAQGKGKSFWGNTHKLSRAIPSSQSRSAGLPVNLPIRHDCIQFHFFERCAPGGPSRQHATLATESPFPESGKVLLFLTLSPSLEWALHAPWRKSKACKRRCPSAPAIRADGSRAADSAMSGATIARPCERRSSAALKYEELERAIPAISAKGNAAIFDESGTAFPSGQPRMTCRHAPPSFLTRAARRSASRCSSLVSSCQSFSGHTPAAARWRGRSPEGHRPGKARLSLPRATGQQSDQFHDCGVEVCMSRCRVDIASGHGEPGARRELPALRGAMVATQDKVRSLHVSGETRNLRELSTSELLERGAQSKVMRGDVDGQ